MKIFCIHHNDVDGRASAAIVRRALGHEVDLYEMNHGEPVPWEAAGSSERIVMVDFSLPAEAMLKLAEGRELVWIDHHISAIRDLAAVSAGWPGLRDSRQAACVLTWQYFYPHSPIPRAIVLIGDRDAWHWLEPETGAFDEALYQQDTDPWNDEFWQPLLDDDAKTLDRLVNQGRVLREARLNNIRRQVDAYGYPVDFEGLKTLVINTRGNGDVGEYALALGYDLAYCYVDNMQNGRLMTFVGLVSNRVDVSLIAQKFGGGGHRGAAGFSFERTCSPFPSEAIVHYG